MAWRFNEVDADVQIADHAALTLLDGDWTIAGWIKLTDNVGALWQYFYSHGVAGVNNSIRWMFREVDDKLQFIAKDAGGDEVDCVSTGTPGTRTDWMHLLVQRLGNTVTQYIDGTADGAETDAAFGAVNPAGNLYLGARQDENPDRRLGGDMAEWGKWDRALDAGERAGLVKGYSPLCYSGLKWYVPMVRAYQELIVPLTVTNDRSTIVRHPPIIYPFSAQQLYALYSRPSWVIPRVRRWGRGSIYELSWRTNNDGDAVLWLDDLQGVIHRVETAPSPIDIPAANYDVALNDRLGVDVLGDACLNRSATVAEPAYPYYSLGTSGHGERVTRDCLEFKVANAGAGGAGVVAIYTIDPL